MASRRPQPMAAPSVLLVTPLNKPTLGTPLDSPTAASPAKSHPACAKFQPANSTSLICVISMATSSVPCTGLAELIYLFIEADRKRAAHEQNGAKRPGSGLRRRPRPGAFDRE